MKLVYFYQKNIQNPSIEDEHNLVVLTNQEITQMG